jgi:hypothetical protein
MLCRVCPVSDTPGTWIWGFGTGLAPWFKRNVVGSSGSCTNKKEGNCREKHAQCSTDSEKNA